MTKSLENYLFHLALNAKNDRKLKYIYPASVLCDFYKVSHAAQYPKNTETVHATWTARISRLLGITAVVAYGFQAFVMKYLVQYFEENFFDRPENEVKEEYERVIKNCLGIAKPDSSHIVALHRLGFLPLLIRAVEEGTSVPIRIPMLTIMNTLPEFYWVTNYVETLMSCELWQMATSATIAKRYSEILTSWATLTGGDQNFVQFQGHDFSMRGMSSLESAKLSGSAHLLSFTGTDTIPAILFHEEFYGANIETELVGTSIPATEHAIQEAGGRDEYPTFKRLLTEVYPSGYVSIVSDTWDLWQNLTDTIPRLKDEILARNGKFVVRPDSGEPILILCGDPSSSNIAAQKGVIQLLWETFGGTVNEKGFKVLDPHVGAIYGDAITLERCNEICRRLWAAGFASTNVVFGIGSYTYQYNTRDTFGFALKTTFGIFGGEDTLLYKNPITDTGNFKKSQKGMVVVYKDEHGTICMKDELNTEEAESCEGINLLRPLFYNGELLRTTTLKEIRAKIRE